MKKNAPATPDLSGYERNECRFGRFEDLLPTKRQRHKIIASCAIFWGVVLFVVVLVCKAVAS